MCDLSPLYMLMSEIGTFTDCAVITDDTDRRYFTGMRSSAGTLVVFRDAAYLIIDGRYIEKARKTVTSCEVILQKKLYEQINELIEKHEVVKVSVDASKTTVSQLNIYLEKLPCEVDSSDELADTIRSIRSIKRGEEIESMIAAQRIAEKAFDHILEYIKIPGVTEKMIQLELDNYMLLNGAEALSFDTIALTGKNTSMPHGVPGYDTVKSGDFVLMDYGAVVNGYHSDMTRTVCFGEPTEEMRTVYDTVLKAQLAALDAVKEGVKASELDAVARKMITDAGYGQCFGHSLGHGVGMDIHELPFASPVSEDILQVDMVVTVEPGIYLPEKFGVRIEDFVVVREDGCFNMTESPKELIVI